jgi:DNA-binding NarL/FixJ family response regulator
MHPVAEVRYLSKLPKTGLSDVDAARLFLNPEGFACWMGNNGLTRKSPEVQAVMQQADDALERGVLDEPEELKPEGYSKVFRADAKELCDFVGTNPRLLPRRMAEVFELCVRQGLSLNACAERLHITKETVRVHLRRLRLLRRRYAS